MDAVGRYRVERRIGSGAFSTVWLGYDDALDIPVAIKLLSDNWIDHADVRSRFLDEARVLRRISDPAIVGVYDIGRLPDGRDYFVMDYADGGTLADRCSEPVPIPFALRLGSEVARAVSVLHAHGVLHRDIKPSNVLLRGTADDPRPVLADLGTAKRLAEASGLTLTAGTPGYMAPEQANGRGLDERTDVYGVAAVCCRMLTGDLPFADDTVADIAARPADRVPDLADAGLPAGIAALLRDALATDPDRRPASADELAARLDALADSEPTVSRATTPNPWTAATTGPEGAATTARPAAEPGGDGVTERVGRPGRWAPAGAALLACAVAVATWLLLSVLLAR